MAYFLVMIGLTMIASYCRSSHSKAYDNLASTLDRLDSIKGRIEFYEKNF